MGKWWRNRDRIRVSGNEALLVELERIRDKVQIDVDVLRIRTGAGTGYAVTGEYTGRGVFTIVEEKAGKGSTAGWGKLKSGAGWVSLDYCTKLV